MTSFCGVRHLKDAVVSQRLAEVTSFEGVLVCRSCVLTAVVRYPGLRGEFQTLGIDFEDGE